MAFLAEGNHLSGDQVGCPGEGQPCGIGQWAGHLVIEYPPAIQLKSSVCFTLQKEDQEVI